MRSSATSQEIEGLLGEVEPLVMERIIDTHATMEEVAEALAGVEDEQRSGEPRPPSSPRVAEVRKILEEILDERDDDASR